MIRVIKNSSSRIKNPTDQKANYIGNCIDVGNDDKYICKFFPDANYLSNITENENNHQKISKSEFEKHVNISSAPKKLTKGKLKYYFVSARKYKINEASLFYIYNENQDIHYFFEK